MKINTDRNLLSPKREAEDNLKILDDSHFSNKVRTLQEGQALTNHKASIFILPRDKSSKAAASFHSAHSASQSFISNLSHNASKHKPRLYKL